MSEADGGQTIEQQALLMGWVPREQFHGAEDKFVDAEAFVEKGKHVMPILHKNNERLLGQVTALTGQITALQQKIADQEASMEDFREFHAEATKAQVAAARKEILDNLKVAKAADDVDAEVEAQAQLSEFDAAQREVVVKPTKPVASATPAAPALSPDFVAWQASNPWFGVDHLKTGIVQGLANKLRAEGNTVQGRPFLDAVMVAYDAMQGSSGPVPDRVEGGRGGGGPGGGAPKSYASMPADARGVCDKQASKFVGTGKIFPDLKSWQAHYAKTYFGE